MKKAVGICLTAVQKFKEPALSLSKG